jgi:DNA-binding transcriptional regulator LsrR (DeoR family)
MKTRRARKPLTDTVKIEMALERFTYDQTKKRFKRLSEVARAFDRDAAIVAKATSDAFDKGLVEIRKVERNKDVEPFQQAVKRNDELEQRLRDRLPSINVRVIDPPGEVAVSSANSDSRKYSDDVHMYLGAALAKDLYDGLYVNQNDMIGLGSGRSVFYTVESLRHHPKLNWTGVKLVSLSGHVNATDYSGQINGGLDADLHVNLLALCIRQRAKQVLFGCPITGHNLPAKASKKTMIDRLEEEKKRSPVGLKWKENRCKLAICGVGSFTTGHRFYEFIHNRAEIEDRDNELIPIVEELQTINSLCRANSIHGEFDYIPVGDICNHLFFIPHPNGAMPVEQKLRAAIQSVNKKLLNVSWEQFSQVDRIIVLSGTKRKAAAVLELVQNRARQPRPLKVQMLYIDAETANGMLALLKAQRDNG